MDSMNPFDGSKPNLIDNKTIRDIESRLALPYDDEGNRVLNGLGSFYNDYIVPNMFPLIVIFLLIIYLTIKYVLKKDREEKEEQDEEKERKRNRVKKKMLKVDPDDIIEKEEAKRTISDLISDDYLLTEDDSEDQNDRDEEEHVQDDDIIGDVVNMSLNGPRTHIDTEQMLNNRETQYDVDKMARIIFGQD